MDETPNVVPCSQTSLIRTTRVRSKFRSVFCVLADGLPARLVKEAFRTRLTVLSGFQTEFKNSLIIHKEKTKEINV